MASFGWKKKIGQKVSKSASSAFESESRDETDAAVERGDVDWLTLAPTRSALVLEDAVAKSKRLQEEAATLAETERYWEAMLKWDQAIQLTPSDNKIYEMKAQAYMALNEVYPAVQAAEKAVLLDPLWWVGHQTLGRARLGLGEVRLAVKCFSRALHLNPADRDLWEDDLKWSADLLQQKKLAEKEVLAAVNKSEEEKQCKIVEVDETSVCRSPPQTSPTSTDSIFKMTSFKRKAEEDRGGGGKQPIATSKKSRTLKSVPSDYVFMRD